MQVNIRFEESHTVCLTRIHSLDDLSGCVHQGPLLCGNCIGGVCLFTISLIICTIKISSIIPVNS